MKHAVVAAFALSLAASAVAAPGTASDAHLRSSELSMTPAARAPRSEAMQSGTYNQLIDHTGKLAGQTFSQRYWYDESYASGPDAPVIYHICGESDVDDAYFLNDYALTWAQQLGARVVFLEHRYYGKSQPFADLSDDHIQYLTLPNIMEDLASFQEFISQSHGWSGKWVAVGGSYSATLAALYRQAHPELVAGALASSAPMISGVGSQVGSQDDADAMSSTDPNTNPGARPWTYQACTSLGYWQAEAADRGAPLDLPSTWLCQQVFGNNVTLNDANAYNNAYDLPFLADVATAPSNILFTYGSDDVWTDIGLATQTSQNSGITVQMITGAGHHFDLNPAEDGDSQAVSDARAQFLKLAQGWVSN